VCVCGNVYVYVCVSGGHVYLCQCVFSCGCFRLCVGGIVFVYGWVSVFVRVCLCVSMHVCVCLCVYMYVCV